MNHIINNKLRSSRKKFIKYLEYIIFNDEKCKMDLTWLLNINSHNYKIYMLSKRFYVAFV